ncbi:MAG: isoprenylcysteine carboxylmethyltransferase family protein [Patescibacteria group bacterium]
MTREKIESLIKRFRLGHSILVVLTIVSIYFWIALRDYNLLKFIGITINIAGLVVWWSARFTLAKNWSMGFGKPKINQLVTHGIYSKIRHPIYWGINLTLTGLIILYPKYWFSVLGILIIVYFFYRMRVESGYLLEKLGEEYRNYKRKTWI